MLSSKASSLQDAAVVKEKERKKNKSYVLSFDDRFKGDYIDVAAMGAAIAFYDMDLLLRKPNDPNCATIANWKCNALVALGQFEEAVRWYEEIIIRWHFDAEGPNAKLDATAELARKQIAKYRGRKNHPVDYRGTDAGDFDDPPFCMYVAEFLRALASGKAAEATKYVHPEIDKRLSGQVLKREWQALVGKRGTEDLTIALQTHSFEWEGRKEQDLGWCYFSISGEGVSEGVSAIVCATDGSGYAIRDLEFGRP